MTLVWAVLLLAVLAVIVVLVFNGNPGSTPRLEVARWRVKAVTDLAYSHDEISTALADAIIERTHGLNADDSVHALEAAIDDILALARAYRSDEPDLAVIVIDTLRREGGPSQLR